ncbi:hypothetical protein MAM1_0049d03285 [Mucor ambiguus]|uniref:Uncharacterized protein n=1 Tax=Mucor ambiguus TaxID=91626 RepID=A0A0C9LTL8_9FUNG|nr:hypothetical protein MAM1_0049d03285 [Mucor ambiguus]
MLTKDLTPNPKAVNIIRPFNHHQHPQQQQQQQQHLFSSQFSPSQIIQRQPNFSSSTNSSSCTFSTASTTATSHTVYNTHPTQHNTTTTTPMIRQPSSETSPGLSFFCQSSTNTLTKANVSQYPFENMHQKQSQQQPPLVISRINLSNFNRRPTIQTDLENGITPLDNVDDVDEDDENNHAGIADDDDGELDIDLTVDDIDDNPQMSTTSRTTEEETHQKTHRMPSSFTPGFGIMSGGLGSFLLRGTMATQAKVQPVEDARVHRKIEDLEIEKKSLLTLNQTLETVVKEQSNTISDLQNRLAAIERPLTPGLDTSSSKNGIMSSPDILEPTDLERYLQDEDAAFERIRSMLLELIEQAQSAVTQTKKASGRVITDIDGQYRNMKRSDTAPHGRPRSVIGDRSSSTKSSHQQKVSRRISLGSINSASTTPSIHINNTLNSSRRLSSSPTLYNSTTSTTTIKPHSSPSTSPIPNRRYSMQRSVSRSSSSAALNTDFSGSSKQQTPAPRASKYTNHKHKATTQHDSQARKWLN